MHWLIVIAIGGVAGWLGSAIMGKEGNGFIFNIFLGIVGGVVGSWIFSLLQVTAKPSLFGYFVTATLGAAILIFIGRLVAGKN
jgi:uncharacterized membrane protein YeaQ/YmgE (transglycosylase-associated protein family)